ncbi:MAG: type II toxin-antitoxin system VapC family toxin, partial [Coriobacteriia bacterium]|nr:type II toxin-antitoxin system VapC family toxin [Coriobacteriia bacterium]
TADEEGVTEADRLQYELAEGGLRLFGPSLLAHELMNVLRRRRHPSLLADAMDDFFDSGVTLFAPDRNSMRGAVRLATDCGVSTFDAAYGALALELDCELITADRHLVRAFQGVVATRLLGATE